MVWVGRELEAHLLLPPGHGQEHLLPTWPWTLPGMGQPELPGK